MRFLTVLFTLFTAFQRKNEISDPVSRQSASCKIYSVGRKCCSFFRLGDNFLCVCLCLWDQIFAVEDFLQIFLTYVKTVELCQLQDTIIYRIISNDFGLKYIYTRERVFIHSPPRVTTKIHERLEIKIN